MENEYGWKQRGIKSKNVDEIKTYQLKYHFCTSTVLFQEKGTVMWNFVDGGMENESGYKRRN